MQFHVVDYRSPTAAQDFCQSLRETGFGVLSNHPLDQNLVEGIYAEWLAFFDSEARWAYAHDPVRHDGYFPPTVSETAKNHTQRDLKEFFHIYPWGRYPTEVSDAARRYYAAGSQLAAELLGWVEAHSPPEVRARYSMPLPQMIQGCDQTLLRVLHYPPLRGDEPADAVRAAAHGDINLLTLLPAATEPGLQVLGQDQRWYDVPCDFGLLIVNIGDMLQEASGHYFPSTVHRVLNPTGAAAQKSRISMPLFLHPHRHVVLSDRYTVGSYFEERMRELRGPKTAAPYQYLNTERAAEFVGEGAEMNALLTTLKTTLDADLPALRRCLVDGDTQGVSKLLHQFKGFAPIFCVDSLVEGVVQAEALSKQATAQFLPHAMAPLMDQLAVLHREVEQQLAASDRA